jgi:SAM-dependent methyltransferase
MITSATPAPPRVQLNLGCGRSALPGWVNIDSVSLPGVDLVLDLNGLTPNAMPFASDSVDGFALSHVLEHIPNTLPLMQELHRIAKPDAVAVVRIPHGASDDAWEDPTHVRAYFTGSFGYFSQPYYWRADYGYRGDWQPRQIDLLVSAEDLSRDGVAGLWARIQRERNLVREMIVELVAVKPIREPRRELQVAPKIVIRV